MKKHDLNHSYQYHIYEIISYMSTKPRIEAKNDFEKDFFKLVNNGVFGKSMKNVRKNRDIKLVTTNRKRNYLVSQTNYYTTKWFPGNLIAMEMKKLKVKMNKLIQAYQYQNLVKH